MKTLYSALFAIGCLGLSACGSDDGPPAEQVQAIASLTGSWATDCVEDTFSINLDATDETSYLIDSWEIDENTATQTFSYFEDAGCSIPITDELANEAETLRVTSQARVLTINFPFGTTQTDLGLAQYITLQEDAVLINDTEQTAEQLEENDVVLERLFGIFVVTPSDRLHINADSVRRPTTVPSDLFYTRQADAI